MKKVYVINNALSYQDKPHPTNKPFERKKEIEKELESLRAVSSHVYYPVERDKLTLIHSEHYVNFLEQCHSFAASATSDDWLDVDDGLIPVNFTKKLPGREIPLHKHSGYYCSDVMTPIYFHSFESAMISASQAWNAGGCSSEDIITYALVTSPGHHAKVEEYGGYCFFNNAVLAALSMKKRHELDMVYILDLDYHAGNGTESICHEKNLEGVIPLSIHIDPKCDYPSFEGIEPANNYLLQGGTTSEEYLSMLKRVTKRISETRPKKGLVIAFGADTWKDDSDAQANFSLEIEDYYTIGKHIFETCGELPTAITQEGGYDCEMVGKIVRRFLEGLSGR